MLASTMMPEAYEEGGEVVGLFTSTGFLLAFILNRLEQGAPQRAARIAVCKNRILGT